MKKLSVTFTAPVLATRPTSLRPRSTSIRCSARSLGSAIRSSASALSSSGVLPARPRAGDGADGDLAVAQPHQDFRAGADDRETRARRDNKERARGSAAAARDRARRAAARRAGGSAGWAPPETHRPRGCIPWRAPRSSKYSVLVMLDSIVAPAAAGRRRLRRGRGRALQVGDGLVQPLAGAGIGGARVHAFVRPDRRHEDDLVAHVVEDRGDGGAQQDRVGQAQRIRRRRWADARPAAPCHSRDSRTGRRPWAAGRRAGPCAFRCDQRAQRFQRLGACSAHEAVGIAARALRLISAVPSRQRQIRSGFRPMME